MNKETMFSSKTCEWETPQDFFDKINAEYNFTLDVCATAKNAKCKRFFKEEEDGLSQEWQGVCWMNPPYGRAISKWLKKRLSLLLMAVWLYAWCLRELIRHGGMTTVHWGK